MSVWEIGEGFRAYVKAQSDHLTPATLASTDAIRHIGGSLMGNPNNFRQDPTRGRTPTILTRRQGRVIAEAVLRGEFWPSGVLNTLCDHEVILGGAFGASSNITQGTTVEASPAPTSTVFTVAAPGSIDATVGVVVNLSTGREIRPVISITGSEITVDPPLSAAPAAGDSVVSCPAYRPASLVTPTSHTFAAYGTNRKYEIDGWVLNKFKLEFDSNGEIIWEASGPARDRLVGAAVQSEPASFTTVGTSIPSGMIGALRIGSAEEEFIKATFELDNLHALQDNLYGTTKSKAAYRKGPQRNVRLSITAAASDDVTILTGSEAGTVFSLLIQCGTTSGQIIGLYIPRWQIDVSPAHDLGQRANYEETWSGQCMGSGSGNNEVRLMLG